MWVRWEGVREPEAHTGSGGSGVRGSDRRRAFLGAGVGRCPEQQLNVNVPVVPL